MRRGFRSALIPSVRRLKVSCISRDGEPLGRLGTEPVLDQRRDPFPDPGEELVGDLKRQRCKHPWTSLLSDRSRHRSVPSDITSPGAQRSGRTPRLGRVK
jgi:hypothetical protein